MWKLDENCTRDSLLNPGVFYNEKNIELIFFYMKNK